MTAENNRENSAEGFTRIEPASISLTSSTTGAKPGSAKSALKNSPLVWLGLGILLTSVLVVIFILPRWVNPPAANPVAPLASTAVPAVADTPTGTVARDKISPWEKAQESRLRKETQDILSQMLEAQQALAERGVEKWAAEDYASALQHATRGDEYYNARDFVNSKTEYENAQVIFSRLVEKMDLVFKSTIEAGNQALEAGNSAAAKQAFQLALAIDAIDRSASVGMERAEKLDDVLALMDKADDLLARDELDEARLVYKEALALDTEFQRARQQVELVDSRILERDFNRQMSAGFAAMDSGRYSEARASFNRALKLRPGAAEAKAAMEQSDHRLTTININSLLAEAREKSAQELWHAALEKYQAALKLDSSLAEALEGQQLASLRSKLHERLEQILARPERLYDRGVYEETVEFQNKLSALSGPGPVLRKQLATLADLLRKADTPVELVLRSDNQTRVTLHKVAELGYFEEKKLSVRPGKYVVVGVREGYRDVRIEFMVDPDKPVTSLSVAAAEKIALGR